MGKFYKYVWNALKYMYTMFIQNTFYLFIYLMSAGILVPSLSQINVLQVVVRSDLFDMNSIVLAIWILIQGKYDLYYFMKMVLSLILWEKTGKIHLSSVNYAKRVVRLMTEQKKKKKKHYQAAEMSDIINGTSLDCISVQ